MKEINAWKRYENFLQQYDSTKTLFLFQDDIQDKNDYHSYMTFYVLAKRLLFSTTDSRIDMKNIINRQITRDEYWTDKMTVLSKVLEISGIGLSSRKYTPKVAQLMTVGTV